MLVPENISHYILSCIMNGDLTLTAVILFPQVSLSFYFSYSTHTKANIPSGTRLNLGNQSLCDEGYSQFSRKICLQNWDKSFHLHISICHYATLYVGLMLLSLELPGKSWLPHEDSLSTHKKSRIQRKTFQLCEPINSFSAYLDFCSLYLKAN